MIYKKSGFVLNPVVGGFDIWCHNQKLISCYGKKINNSPLPTIKKAFIFISEYLRKIIKE